MISTISQTEVITPKYTLSSTPLRASPERKSRRSSGSPSKKSSRVAKPSKTKNVIASQLQNAMKEKIKTFMPLDSVEGSVQFPQLAWGEKGKVGLSKIGRAERDIEIWEEVRRAHEETPDALPFITKKLEEVQAKRIGLVDCEENSRVSAADPASIAIKDRIEDLEAALVDSTFEPEADNIRGAIAAYESGEIRYSSNYTILYAGKVVDTTSNYSGFVRDRQERLDRYAKEHDVHPETKPTMMMATAKLDRGDSWTNLGPYHVYQGFWKSAGWVRRIETLTGAVPTPLENRFTKSERDRKTVYCQESGPRQAFRSLLDSGATYPSLFAKDLDSLGIDHDNYACQAIMTMTTTTGRMVNRIFEMFVCVLDENKKQLVGENPVWPLTNGSRGMVNRFIGGLCPVVEVGGEPTFDENGFETCTRLSGLLPFVSAYISSTPTMNSIFLGEDRADVLGAHRMPGQRRWDTSFRPEREAYQRGGVRVQKLTTFHNPIVRFEHHHGLQRIVDEDKPKYQPSSTLTIYDEEDEEIDRIEINPTAELGKKRRDKEDRDVQHRMPLGLI